ncbi:phage tail spike protein [Ornithinibacillus caprae]|uniref:phage tail spike protein n=1 Tax=Ornithinibacillus caprae TaxID=2678566 RepID=UPI0012D99041|nr:phage tail spike protein [Ornithinibacillus caprae]
MSTIDVLHHQSDEIVDFYSNKKKKFWNDTHFSSLENYVEYFNFIVSYDNSENVQQRNRVIIPGEDGDFREFIINESLKHEQNKEVYTIASFVEDLKKDKTIEPQVFEGITVNTFLDTILLGTGWQRGKTDYLGIRTIPVENTSYPFSVLKTGAKTFEGELNFRIETEGSKVTGRYVDLVERQGSWNGKEITVGKDLIGVKRRERSDIITALECYGPEREDGTRLKVIVTDEDARKRWGRPSNNPQHLWGIYEPQSVDEEMTEERLRSLGETELKKRVNSVVEYEADQASIEHIFGFDHEKVRKGDTVRIKDTSYTPALYLEARVKSVERSLSNPSQKKYILGDFIEFEEADVMALFRSMQKALSQKISEQQLQEYAEKVIPEQDTPPENPTKGDKWVDTSKNPPQMNLYDGSDWHTIKGEKGDPGDQGIQGPPGEDGLPSYTHIAYANSSDGTVDFSVNNPNRDYIGMYVDSNSTDSTDPSMYKWTKTKGLQGDQGIPGQPGEDGRTPYLHTAYATSSDGTSGFSTTDPTNKSYIGTYTDYVQSDSTDPSKYTWALFKGPKGDKGDQGPQGEQGPSGKDGIAYMGPDEPSNPAVNGTWFQTNSAGEVIAIKKWNGSTWDTAQMTVDVLNVLKLSALSADLGNVTAGDIRGVTMNLGNGQFIVEDGNVTFGGHLEGATGSFSGEFRAGNTLIDDNGILVDSGGFRIIDENTQLESLIYGASNMVNDHSFELVPLGTGSWSHATRRVDVDRMGNYFLWDIQGAREYARIQSTLNTSEFQRAHFGHQAAILENRYFWKQYVPLNIANMLTGRPYTVSVYFAAYEDTSAPVTSRLLVHAYDWEFNLIQSSSVANVSITINPNEPYLWKRVGATIHNLPQNTAYLRIRLDNSEDIRTLADGVQLIPYEYPTIYQPEDALFKYIQGITGYN